MLRVIREKRCEISDKKSQKQKVAVYFRTATEEQLAEPQTKYMKEWTEICQAYCDKVSAELLFVNLSDFGCEMPNWELRHINADELAELLSTEQSFTSEKDNDSMQECDSSDPELKMF